jgi:hypothetical protein
VLQGQVVQGVEIPATNDGDSVSRAKKERNTEELQSVSVRSEILRPGEMLTLTAGGKSCILKYEIIEGNFDLEIWSELARLRAEVKLLRAKMTNGGMLVDDAEISTLVSHMVTESI